MRSTNGHYALTTAYIIGSDDQVTNRARDLAKLFEGRHGELTVAAAGSGVVYAAVSDRVQQDLTKAELIAFPITFVLLVLVFGGLVAALMPLLVGIVSIVGTLLVLPRVLRMAITYFGHRVSEPEIKLLLVVLFGLGGLATQMKDPTVYPNYTPAVQQAMLDETSAFVQNVAFGGDGRLATFLGAPYSYINGALASLYGVQASGTALQRTNLNPAQRAGLLTQASFLALTGSPAGSNPVRRGKAVYTKLLCHTLPPPPPNVPAPAPASAGGTTRQRFEAHDQNPCASGCHRSMDPIGFAFENFDGIGQYRTMDNGLPVDATGSITLDGTAQTFNDAVGLMALLAKSPEVRTCFAGEWSRYGLSRVDTPADAASLQATAAAFSSDAASLQNLMAAVATMRSFRYRSLSPGETP